MKKQLPAIQKQQIASFIKQLSNKNYAEANKSLQKTVESKLFNKISQYKDINIFK
jgi:Mg/Co/Ni transporter MgtE